MFADFADAAAALLFFRSVQIAQSNILLLSSIIDYLISGKMQIIMP